MSPGQAPQRRGSVGVTAALVALCVLLAVVVCWPVSLYPESISLDQATPGHLVYASSMQRWGLLSPNRMIGFPGSQILTPLALPVLGLTLALGRLLPVVVAWNLSVETLVVLQGLAFVALGAAWGWTTWQRVAAIVAAETCPLLLAYLGNGQVEHVGLASFALITWALWRPGWVRLAVAGLGLTLAVIFSPYQAIMAGPLVLVLASRHGWRRLLAAGGVVLLCGLLARFHYGGEVQHLQPTTDAAEAAVVLSVAHEGGGVPPAMPAQAMVGLARNVEADTAGLVDLVVPRVDGVLGHVVGDSPRPEARLRAARSPPRWVSLPEASPTELPFSASYLGVLTLLAGGLGLWWARGRAGSRPLALWAALCLVLALGANLSVFAGRPTGLVLPGALLSWAPSLSFATSTVRFLGGVAFVCVLGIAWLVRTWRPWQVAAFAVVLALTNLLFTPAHWPRTAVGLAVDDLAALVEPGPVAVWPGVGESLTEDHLWLSLALDHPVAIFNPTNQEQRDDEGVAKAWLAEARAAGVRVLLERQSGGWRRHVQASHRPPLPAEARALGDAQGYRVWLLDGGVGD